MIVADTNIISYLLLPTIYSDKAEKLFLSDPDWIAPVLWRSEFRNVLALYIRKEILSLEQAVEIQEEAEFMLKDAEYEVPSHKVLSLVKDSTCSAYDCEFIALAQMMKIKLITADKKVLKGFAHIASGL